MAIETHEKQMKDSDMIFTEVSMGGCLNYNDAKQCIDIAYVPDMSISRAGISHAMKRLEKFYEEKGK